ncbi:MAG: hypothetical protein AVDCRST_MAG03-744 [uncultured Rubrobacteraceae bacterium]|uniref:Uncharacterized protein n=1 Tax=uncultured Rubrobacteraceae bacterium TaxID=349277 RepID=A0A6J4NN06_9ACTN|nr:MAG: hypothetical protein AVDCRST_MAG03-744 [uncultured Rubrobacteraceae bacterium]
MKDDLQGHSTVPVSTWLDNAVICQEAIDAAGDLPRTNNAEFERFYTYLVVDEPIVQLMPGYFLPPWAEQRVQPEALRTLAVTAKLENARNRWLDEMVDDHEALVSLTSSQELNRDLVSLTNYLYASILPRPLAADFFERLAMLYARHSLSLVLDGKRRTLLRHPISLTDYEVHAKARHSSVRAPLDALLLLVEAHEDQSTVAADSWHAWGLGAQLYDDALDVEEDFSQGILTWTVSRTLECFEGQIPENPNEFYAVALQEGVVVQTLKRAEDHFTRAAELARLNFPRWTPVQHGCRRQARALRKDYERLLTLEPSDR